MKREEEWDAGGRDERWWGPVQTLITSTRERRVSESTKTDNPSKTHASENELQNRLDCIPEMCRIIQCMMSNDDRIMYDIKMMGRRMKMHLYEVPMCPGIMKTKRLSSSVV